MKHLEVYEASLIRTDQFSGESTNPVIVDYLGLMSKYKADKAAGKNVRTNYLKTNIDGKSAYSFIIRFFKDFADDLKVANSQAYAKLDGDNLIKRLDNLTQ